MKESSKENERIRKQNYLEKTEEKCLSNHNVNDSLPFSNRMSKCRARKRLEKALPQTPQNEVPYYEHFYERTRPQLTWKNA
jgi:hypothetical protein